MLTHSPAALHEANRNEPASVAESQLTSTEEGAAQLSWSGEDLDGVGCGMVKRPGRPGVRNPPPSPWGVTGSAGEVPALWGLLRPGVCCILSRIIAHACLA